MDVQVCSVLSIWRFEHPHNRLPSSIAHVDLHKCLVAFGHGRQVNVESFYFHLTGTADSVAVLSHVALELAANEVDDDDVPVATLILHGQNVFYRWAYWLDTTLLLSLNRAEAKDDSSRSFAFRFGHIGLAGNN